MNGHLPECPSSSPDPLAADCCCSRLRACEQRVLDAAREAIAALDIGRDVRFSVDVKADALAAIDALRLPDKP